MGRILAIDYGTKRVGLASTDPLQIIASPLETVAANELLSWLKEYFSKEVVDVVVIGMPKTLNNQDTDATQPVRSFVKKFKNHFPGKQLVLHDERFTSGMALQAMIQAGSKKKDRRVKGNIDKVSAAIILQSYLESIT